MNKKGVLASWTIWFGIAQIIYGVVGFLSGQIDSNTAGTLVTTGIGTVVLRFKTSAPIV